MSLCGNLVQCNLFFANFGFATDSRLTAVVTEPPALDARDWIQHCTTDDDADSIM